MAIIQTRGGRPRSYCEVCSPPKSHPAVTMNPIVAVREAKDALGEPQELSVFDATMRRLVEYGRVADPLGQAALVLARAIDSGRGSGLGLAAIIKEHREALSAACAGAKGEEDALDALGRRLA